jgi:hypothetical protein
MTFPWRLSIDLQRSGRQELTIYGSLLLKGAVAAASVDDRRAAHEYLAQAQAIAERTGESSHLWFAFGPTNVAIHHVWLEVELGDPSTALIRAEVVRTDSVPVHLAERRASHLITVAWAHYLRRQDDEAVAALRQAREHAPEQLLFTGRVCDMLTAMLRRDRRHRQELRSLAAFAGVA